MQNTEQGTQKAEVTKVRARVFSFFVLHSLFCNRHSVRTRVAVINGPSPQGGSSMPAQGTAPASCTSQRAALGNRVEQPSAERTGRQYTGRLPRPIRTAVGIRPDRPRIE